MTDDTKKSGSDAPQTDDLTVDTSSTTPTPSPASTRWNETVAAFAAAVGKTAEETAQAFQTLVDANDDGVATLADPDCVSDDDLKNVFPSVKVGNLKKALKSLRESSQGLAVADGSSATNAFSMPQALIPEVPNDERLLEALTVGGVPKFDESTVTSVARVMLADQARFFDSPDLLREMADRNLDALQEPASEIYYEIDELLELREAAKVMRAMKFKKRYASVPRRRELREKLEGLPRMLSNFHRTLDGWCQSLSNQPGTNLNLGQLVSMMGQFMSGGRPSPAMAMMNNVPDPSTVVAASKTFVNGLNEILAGTRAGVVRYMMAEAIDIKRILKNPAVLQVTGCVTYERLIGEMGIGVPDEMVGLEESLPRYMLGIIGVRTQSPDKLPLWLVDLWNIGSTIDFDALSRSGGVSTASRTRRNSAAYEQEYGHDRR